MFASLRDLVVKVASLAGMALLKIVAWSDRRFERDAQDFGLKRLSVYFTDESEIRED